MFTKTMIAAAFGLIGLTGFAHADGAPFLYGNYSANVLNSYGTGGQIMEAPEVHYAPSAKPQRAFGFSAGKPVTSKWVFGAGAASTESAIGNYEPNIRLEDIRGGY